MFCKKITDQCSLFGIFRVKNGGKYLSLHFYILRTVDPPRKVDRFFRNFSAWTKTIHSLSDRNFRKFWLNGSGLCRTWQKRHLLLRKRERMRDRKLFGSRQRSSRALSPIVLACEQAHLWVGYRGQRSWREEWGEEKFSSPHSSRLWLWSLPKQVSLLAGYCRFSLSRRERPLLAGKREGAQTRHFGIIWNGGRARGAGVVQMLHLFCPRL